jgi:hypothetical protein
MTHLLCVVGLHKNKFEGAIKRSRIHCHDRYEQAYQLHFTCARCDQFIAYDVYKLKDAIVYDGFCFEESTIHRKRLFNAELEIWKN